LKIGGISGGGGEKTRKGWAFVTNYVASLEGGVVMLPGRKEVRLQPIFVE
jgi:hypothetical protein